MDKSKTPDSVEPSEPHGADSEDDSAEDGNVEQESSGVFARFLRNLVILAVVFAIGFLTQVREMRSLRTSEREVSAEVDQLRRELEVERLGSALAGAALYASHGDYAPARTEAIRFFDGLGFLRMQVDAEHAESLVELLERRDDIVGSLGTGESFGIYQLADVFARFQNVMTGRQYSFTVPTGLPPELRHN